MEDVLELDLADGRGEVVREDGFDLVVKTDGAGLVVGVAYGLFVRFGVGGTC